MRVVSAGRVERAGRAGLGAWLLLSWPCHPAGLEPPQKVELLPDVTRHQLDGLQPGTAYRLTLYTLLEGREVATPATVVPTGKGSVGLSYPESLMTVTSPTFSSLEGLEEPVRPVMDLKAVELPGQRVRVSWNPVPGATEYRFTVRTTQGKAEAAGKVHSTRSPSLQHLPTLSGFLGPPSSFWPSAS